MSDGIQVIPTDDFSPYLTGIDAAAHFVHLNGYIGGDISWAVTRSYGRTFALRSRKMIMTTVRSTFTMMVASTTTTPL